MRVIYSSNVWKFYLLKFISSLELTIAIFVLFLLANNLSMTQVMLLETIFIVMVLALEMPSGAFADIYGRKTSLTLSLVLAAFSFAVFGIGSSFWVFLAAQVLMALAWSLESGADSALIYDSLKEDYREKEYSKVFGRSMFIALFTWAGASLVSGLLAVHVSYQTLFFLTSASFLLAAALAWTLKEPPLHNENKGKYIFKHLSLAVAFTKNNKIVRSLILYYGIFAALGHLAWFLIQPFYDNSQYPKAIIGIATAIYFASAGLGSLSAEAFIKRFNDKKILKGTLFLAGVSFIGIAFIDKILALILITVMSFACGLRDVVVSTCINEHTRSHQRATVVSVQSMSKSIMYAIFAPLIGLLTDLFSPAAAFGLMGFSLVLFFVYYIIISRETQTYRAIKAN